MPLLAFQKVSFAYGPQDVLTDLDLHVERGELVAVVGPNGAGKTTLLRLASGYLRPRGGQVLLEGRPVEQIARSAAARRIAGVVADEGASFPFTVRETVALGRHPWRSAFGRMRPADTQRIDDALRAADLTALADRALPALSSGERQRVAVGRCLAQGGDLVLLDEPTSHLDLGHRVRMLALFRRRARSEQAGVLAALHDLNLAAAVADRVILLVAGRIAAEGAPAEVLTARAVESAFGARVHVIDHPDTGTPVLVPAVAEGDA